MSFEKVLRLLSAKKLKLQKKLHSSNFSMEIIWRLRWDSNQLLLRFNQVTDESGMMAAQQGNLGLWSWWTRDQIQLVACLSSS